MAVDNDALVVKIRADIKSLQAGLRQAGKEAEIAGKSMQDSLGGSAANVQKIVANMVSSVGAGLVAIAGGAVLAGGALAAITRRSLDFADSLVKASDMTGIGTEALQEYRYAAGQAGVSTEELEQGLALYTKRVGEARGGNEEAVKSFKALGISQEELKANSPEQTLARVFAILETIPGAADRAAYANEAFGKSGLRLAILAGQGTGALEEMRKKARDLGLVVGDDLVRAGDDAGDAIDSLKAVIESGLNKAVLVAAPDIKAFIEALTSDPQRIQEVTRQLVSAAGAIFKVGSAAVEWAGAVGNFFAGRELASEVGKASLAAQQIEYYRDRLASAEKLGLTTQVEILTAGLRDAEAAFKDADSARMKLVKNAIGNAIGFDPAAIGKQPEGAQIPLRDPKVPDPTRPSLGTLGKDPGDDKGASRRKAAAERELKDKQKSEEALIQQAREFVATEAALEEMRYQARREALLKMNAERFGGEQAKNDLLLQQEQKHQADMIAISDQTAARIRQVDDAIFQQRESKYQMLEGVTLDSQAQELIAADEKYSAQLAALGEFSEAELEALGGYNAVKEAIEKQHQENMLGIKKRYLKSGLDFLSGIKDDELRSAADNFAANIQALGTHSKKAFEISKALGIANGLVSTYVAANRAYEALAGIPYIGPALGAAAAATAAAAGLANVAAIKNAKFGGGASPAVRGAAAAGGGVVGDQNQPGGGGGGGGGRSPQISLSLVGDNFSRDQVRALIEQINDALGDGAKFRGS